MSYPEPPKFMFSESSRIGLSVGHPLSLQWPPSVAWYAVKDLAIVNFGLSLLPRWLFLNVQSLQHVRAHPY